MSKIRQILARREAIRTELHSLMQSDTLSPEQEQRAKELEAEAGRLNDEERRAVLLDELDRRATGTQLTGTADSNFDAIANKVTILDVVRAGMGLHDPGADRAREVSKEIELRNGGRKPEGYYWSTAHGPAVERRAVQMTSVNALGGFLVPEQLMSPIELLADRLIVRTLGATFLTGLQGNITIPRITAGSTGYWIGENQAITASNVTLDALQLQPKSVGGIVEFTRNMVLQSSPDVATLVQNDLLRVITTAIDTGAINGSGVSSQPFGILNYPNITTQYVAGNNGGAPSLTMLLAAITAVDTSNALQGSLGWMTNAKAVGKMRQTLKTTADVSSNMLMNDPSTLLGYPVRSSQLVPSTLTRRTSVGVCSAIVFGNWADLIVGMWSNVDISVNPWGEDSFSKGNVKIRAMATVDTNVRHVESFVVLPDVTTT